ncbi:MAG: NAD(P)H-binding protein, partial [Acidobacteria bacterium]|nr:NAD(P)H-binding protein [Acidobacteriota bacterium]
MISALKNRAGIRPIAVARTPAKAERLGVEVREGDYDNGPQLEAAFRGVDAVLLVSGMAPPAERLVQHKRVIDAAERAGVKRLVFAGIVVTESGNGFNAVQQTSTATEEYLKRSNLEWVIGQNGIYIEPDLEYLDNYRKAGKIANCAADGRCAYTCRPELALAYAEMLSEPRHLGETYVLAGRAITQSELAAAINDVFGTNLTYESMGVEECRAERQAALGDFIGAVIAGIYEG